MVEPTHTDALPTLWTRRSWLLRGAWSAVGAASFVWLFACVRLFFPRVHDALPTAVRVGDPNAIPVGALLDRFKQEHNFVIVRTVEGFYALRTVCTHLGCIPRWQPMDARFRCFCHGSGFSRDGNNIEGPAPRPLERLHIALDESGQIVVDTARRFRSERGDFARPGAFLPFAAAAKEDRDGVPG